MPYATLKPKFRDNFLFFMAVTWRVLITWTCCITLLAVLIHYYAQSPLQPFYSICIFLGGSLISRLLIGIRELAPPGAILEDALDVDNAALHFRFFGHLFSVFLIAPIFLFFIKSHTAWWVVGVAPLVCAVLYWVGEIVGASWANLCSDVKLDIRTQKEQLVEKTRQLQMWFIPIVVLSASTYLTLGALGVLDLAINAMPVPKIGAYLIVAIPLILVAAVGLVLVIYYKHAIDQAALSDKHSPLLAQKETRKIKQITQNTTSVDNQKPNKIIEHKVEENQAAQGATQPLRTYQEAISYLTSFGPESNANKLKRFIKDWKNNSKNHHKADQAFAEALQLKGDIWDKKNFPINLAQQHLGWETNKVDIAQSKIKLFDLIKLAFNLKKRDAFAHKINQKDAFIIKKDQTEINNMQKTDKKTHDTIVNNNHTNNNNNSKVIQKVVPTTAITTEVTGTNT